jgi:hypothetical protein
VGGNAVDQRGIARAGVLGGAPDTGIALRPDHLSRYSELVRAGAGQSGAERVGNVYFRLFDDFGRKQFEAKGRNERCQPVDRGVVENAGHGCLLWVQELGRHPVLRLRR